MKKRFAALLFLGWLIPAGMAWAEPSISVNHTLTGYTMGTDSVTISYTLNVKNTGTSNISNVTLTLLPITIRTEEINLNIAILDPQAEVHIPFTFTTPMLLDQNVFKKLPLFWDCVSAVDGIDPIWFPVISSEGGAL